MNLLEKIEPHAKRIEDVADKMERDGIGGHVRGGHVAVLRRMAADMRADAAHAKVPHAFDDVHARAAVAVHAAADGELLTVNAAAAKNSAAAQQIRALVSRAKFLGAHIDPDAPVNIRELDRALAGKDISARFALKSDLYRFGLIPA